MRLRLVGHEAREHPAETHRLLAQRGPHPVLAGGRGIPLVEDEVDDLEDRCESLRQLVRRRQLEADLLVAQSLLGANDALGHRRLGHEEGSGDLVGGQSTEAPERERDP